MSNLLTLVLYGSLVAGQEAARPYDGTPGLPPPTLAEMVKEQEYQGDLKITNFKVARDAGEVTLPGGMTCDPATINANKDELSKSRAVEIVLAAHNSTSGKMTLKVISDDAEVQAEPVSFDFEYDAKTGRISAETDVSGWHVTIDFQTAYRVSGKPPYSNANFVFAGKMTGTAGESAAIRFDMLIRAKSVKWSTLEQPLRPNGGKSPIQSAVDKILEDEAFVDWIHREAADKWRKELEKNLGDKKGEDSGVRFSGLTGQIDIYPYDDEDARRGAGLKSVIRNGDVIETGEDSWAVLSFPDMTTFVMKPETKIVMDLPRSQDKLSLVFGKIWTNVKKIIKDGTMEVQMSQAVTGTKGTQFVCEESGSESTIKVFEGQVSVTSKADGKVKRLKAGEMISVFTDGFGPKMNFDVEEEQATWPTPEDEEP